MKKTGKIIFVAAVLTVLASSLLLTGCGKKSDTTAEEVVETFMEAAKETDIDAMLECTVSEDWASYTQQLLDVEDWKDFVVLVAPKMTYEITDVEESSNEATVTVDVTYIDAEQIYVDAFNEYASQALSIVMENEDATEEDLEGILGTVLEEMAETMEETYTDVTLTFVCSGKNDWKISEVDDQMQDVITSNLTLVSDALDAQEDEETTDDDTSTDEETTDDDTSTDEETTDNDTSADEETADDDTSADDASADAEE